MARRPLRQRITFESRSTVKDATWRSVSAENWLPAFPPVFASVIEMAPARAERQGEQVDTTRRVFDIEIRCPAPVDGSMRIKYGDLALQIIAGPTPNAAKDRLILRGEWVSSEGARP